MQAVQAEIEPTQGQIEHQKTWYFEFFEGFFF